MSILELPRPVEQRAGADAAGAETVVRHPWILTLEQIAYLVLGLIALLAHLWALGERSLHHDETLHAAYSWNLFTGRGYMHDPLLHGPFLYHFGALIFFLFGDNDVTARLGAALFGAALTLMPYLVRRELGRVAALAATIYLLISPVFLYVGRFIRHDIYSMVFEMLVFVAIVRYASTCQARWLYIGAAAFALMVVNQETSYLFLIMMGAPLVLLFLWRVYKPGIPILGAIGFAVAALIFVLPGEAQVDGAHNAIRDPDGRMQYTPGPVFGWYPLETYDNMYALRIRNRADTDGGRGLLENFGAYMVDLGKFFGHPAVLLAIGLLAAGAALLGWLIWGRLAGGESRWQQARAAGDAVTTVYGSLAAGWRWLVALGIFLAIYTIFFTAFFTNLLGFITGATGSVLYWLAQHNVERGGQPGYYYAILLFVYEPLILLWAGIGMLFVTSDLLARWRGARSGDAAASQPATGAWQSFFVIYLLAWWSFGAFAIYSWAGEKMPWLTIHVALPLVLLGAWAFQRAIRGVADDTLAAQRADDALARARSSIFTAQFIVYLSVFVSIITLGCLLMNAYINSTVRLVPITIVPAFILILIVLLVVAAGIRWGWRWSLATLALSVTLMGSLYTVRNAFRVAYLSGDTPREMLIYTQTSPDVMRVIRRLEEASRRRGGGLDLPVIYDNETVWSWYLRDFTAAERSSPQLSGPPDDRVQAVLMLQENLDQYPQNRAALAGFRIQRLPLRWWFPEQEMYDDLHGDWRSAPLENASLLARVLRAPLDSTTIERLWQFLIYRRTHAPLGSTDFVIAVRPLLADQIGLGTGGKLAPEGP